MADFGTIAVGQTVFGEMHAAPALVQTFTLPPLPYAYDALEPYISAEIMTLHHDKHHQAYVTNLNAALAQYATAVANGRIPDQIALQAAIRFHGGGHLNHALFWPSLAPAASADAREPEAKAPTLVAALQAAFGDLDRFRAAFSQALLALQGSGWGWLVKTPPSGGGGAEASGPAGLRIVTTKDQDPIVGPDMVPVLGIDMWEHAYYLQYKNSKQSYVDSVWNIINWTTAEHRYTAAAGQVYDGIEVVLST